MTNNELKCYVEHILKFMDIVRKLVDNNFFDDQLIESIMFIRYKNYSVSEDHLMLDFYDKDGMMMSTDRVFRKVTEIKRMYDIISDLNELPAFYINDKFPADEIITIELLKNCETELLELLLPKKLQIELNYAELQNEMIINSKNDHIKIKI
jgi:hypothetical protein